MPCTSWTSVTFHEYMYYVGVKDCDQWSVCLLFFNLSVRAQSHIGSKSGKTCCPHTWSFHNLKGNFVEKLFWILAIFSFNQFSLILAKHCNFPLNIGFTLIYHKYYLCLDIVVSHIGCPVAPGYWLFCPGTLIFMILITMTLYLNDITINHFVWIKLSYCMFIVLICLWTCHLYWLNYGILSSVFDFGRNGWLPQTSPNVLPKGV